MYKRHHAQAAWVTVLIVISATLLHGRPAAAPRVEGVDLGLIRPTYPDGKPPAPEEVQLGRALFDDPVLSSDGTISCASCHAAEAAFADRRPVSVGVGGKAGIRNSPTLWNAVFLDTQSWDGRHDSLEAQTLGALTAPDEMNLDLTTVPAAVDTKYGERLRKLYGDTSASSVARAIAAFQRTLVAGGSPFDRYLFGGEDNAISDSAKRGFRIFLGDGRCAQCHTIRCEDCHPFGGASALFTDGRFHNIGIGFDKGTPRDLGRSAITGKAEDLGSFRTPTLRNVELTAPYMHDGSLRTLEEVVEHYDKGGNPNRNLDPDVAPLELDDQAKADLVAFMRTLTSDRLKPLIAAGK